MSLILPPAVQAEMETRRDARIAKALDRELKQHDSNLGLVWVKSNVHPSEVPDSVIPGRWHVRRNNPILGVSTYMAITRPDGGYREPDFGVLNEVKKRDLSNLSPHEVKKRFEPEDPIKKDKREKDLKDEQRRDEMKADFRAARRVAGENVYKRSMGKGGKKKNGT